MKVTATYHSTTKQFDCYLIDKPCVGKIYLPKSPILAPAERISFEVQYSPAAVSNNQRFLSSGG